MVSITQQQNEQIIALAKQAQSHSYSPYSNFKVGAAIITDTNDMVAGCNVENASYPLGQCAEATAIGSMVANGSKRIKHLVIVSPNGEYCYPCGGCRQKIKEFAAPDTVVELVDNQGNRKHLTIDELLPFAFSL